MIIVIGVALSLIAVDKLVGIAIYNKEMEEEIRKELTIVR